MRNVQKLILRASPDRKKAPKSSFTLTETVQASNTIGNTAPQLHKLEGKEGHKKPDQWRGEEQKNENIGREWGAVAEKNKVCRRSENKFNEPFFYKVRVDLAEEK